MAPRRIGRVALAWYAWAIAGYVLAWSIGIAAAIAYLPVPEATTLGFAFGIAFVSTAPAFLRAVRRWIR